MNQSTSLKEPKINFIRVLQISIADKKSKIEKKNKRKKAPNKIEKKKKKTKEKLWSLLYSLFSVPPPCKRCSKFLTQKL